MADFYGQIIIGAPGAGKSTYCQAAIQMLEQLKRPVIYMNLDPANDLIPGRCDIDIRELIKVEEVMDTLRLGPNGALRYCMQTLMKNVEWIQHKLENKKGYLLIDMPGQLELYNSDDSVQKIVAKFREWGFRLCAVHLSDCMHCSDAGKFVSVILSALSVMINLELAQVNVLSKFDLLPNDLPFDIDFFERLPDLSYLVDRLDDHPALVRYKGLCAKLSEVVEDYNLVSFVPLDVMDKEKTINLIRAADQANGFAMMEAQDLRDIVMKG